MSAEAPQAQATSVENNSQKGKSSPVKAGKAQTGAVTTATQLESSWSFWFAKRTTKSENFAEGLCCLVNVDSVESFWLHYAHIKRPADIPLNSELSFFRSGAKPMWESFPEGGSWSFRLKKKNPILNRIWEELILACVGEQMGEPYDVVGVCISIRQKEDVISIWNRDSKNRSVLGEKLKILLHMEPNCPMEYKQNNGKITHSRSASQQQQSHPVHTAPVSVPVAKPVGQAIEVAAQ
eukprot:TRINITY_DN6839_c0_g1_i1.p1 TRINITY_DN6839_c0_g1~~TRINITY_DN6839_c0_g1_i1.p1  ORF type:complete len:237 (-),score=50.71 TRINITY_DN6839_c0_g1_i1:24-734(-)